MEVCPEASAEETAQTAGEQQAIIVTAQRRPEKPEQVPISLTALSAEHLEQALVTDIASLGKVVPSLQMTRTGAFTQPFLRGVGKRSNVGVENSVATYVDGVYLASSIGALLDLRGIDRVEVLNGPQGTLFGRNTSGGVIQIVTRDPSAETSGEFIVTAGTYEHFRGDAYLTAGTDRLAANLAVSLSHNGGFGTNFFTGKKDQGEIDHSLVGRSKWVWRPAEQLKLTLAGDYQDIDQNFMQLPVKRFPPIGNPRVTGFRDGDQDWPDRYHFHYGGVSAKAEVELGSLKFMSLSAVRRLRANYATDLDLGPQLLLAGVTAAEQRQFSQEFQLQSGDSSFIRWTAGLYYIHLDERLDPFIFLYGGSYSTLLGGRIEQTLSDVGNVSSYAAYGQATLPLGQSTRLTAGLRDTIERRSVRANGERLFDNPPFIRPIPGLPLLTEEPLRQDKTFRELTWRASLDRKLSDSLMGYVSASRGFQSGGWNLQTPQNPSFDPEKLDDFEAGFKYLDRSHRFQADGALFYYRYSDLQVSAFTPIGSMTTNAASADIYGLDLQFDGRLGEWTRVMFGGQLLRARYNHFRNATCTDYSEDAAAPYAPISCDATGNRLPFAPRFKLNLGTTHQISLGKAGSLLLSGNLAYNGGYFSEPDNVVRQNSFTTLDASAEWRPVQRGPSIRLWVSNLTDAHYYDSLVTFPTTGVLQRPAAPRRFGVSVGYDF